MNEQDLLNYIVDTTPKLKDIEHLKMIYTVTKSCFDKEKKERH